MTSRKVWTAAEIEHMSSTERRALFEANIVWDLDDAPPELKPLIERARARALDHIAQTEHTQQ